MANHTTFQPNWVSAPGDTIGDLLEERHLDIEDLASITKLFTATAVLILREDGALTLEDSVRRHLPWFVMGRQPEVGRDAVTIRHLLTHTSGYREYLNTLALGGRRLLEGDYIDRSEIIDIVRRQPELQNQPGAELVRIDYVGPTKGKAGKNPHGNHAPSVTVDAEGETVGLAPLTVSFTSEASDPEGQPLTYEWDFGDGSPASDEEDPVHTYTEFGTFTAELTVTDPEGHEWAFMRRTDQ